MFLIMSAAFVGQELESEFGKIPPSFLPLGNRRLFQHQVSLAPQGVDVYLSVPESFAIMPIDREWLEDRNVTILLTPDNLSLGASLVAAVNISGHTLDTPLHVLYGDTLFRQLPVGDDIIGMSDAKGSYNWAALTSDNVHWLKSSNNSQLNYAQKIMDGYFKFSNPRELVKSITQSEWSFIEGLNKYHLAIGLTPIESEGWLDFGHVNTYYNSKAEFTTQRAFNELTITPKWIEKSSIKNDKIAAEANWFSSIPYELRGNTPQYLGSECKDEKTSYRLEYLHLTALNELFVFSELPSHIWTHIISSCLEFLTLCQKYSASAEDSTNSLDVLFSKKTEQRLNEYCLSKNITMDCLWNVNGNGAVSLKEIITDSQNNLPTIVKDQTVLHGDFCFSNILYDFRAAKIKTIDPRGMTPESEKTIYGDLRYDIAKLSHSILGLYDLIIAGYYKIEVLDKSIILEIAQKKSHRETQQKFIQLVEDKFGLTSQNLYAMQIQLFLSMLPLHSDNPKRQQALFANAFRLHQILVRLDQ